MAKEGMDKTDTGKVEIIFVQSTKDQNYVIPCF